MTNVIFGSGIVGLIAKYLLAGDWEIVPFHRSRYFSFNPPLADNFISRDADIDEAMVALGGKISPHFYKRVYSYKGALLSEHNEDICRMWFQKIFGDSVPSHSIHYWKRRLITPIYDIRVNQVYERLLNHFMPTLVTESRKGDVTEIGPHYFVRNGQKVEFDNAISTIPLNILLKLMNRNGVDLKAINLHYLHVQSDKIDFEGANQTLVADGIFDFYKVTNISKNHYLFYFVREIMQPGTYLLPIIGRGDILDGTSIGDALPIGEIPQLEWLDDYGIFCIGSNAQWDWCADVGSNILRVVRYSQRGYKTLVKNV